MLSIIVLIIFIGCYALYHTSRRAFLNTDRPLEKWLHSHPRPANVLGLALLFVAFGMGVYGYGLGVAAFTWFIVLMILLGGLILIYPLRIVGYKHVALLFMTLLILELSLT